MRSTTGPFNKATTDYVLVSFQSHYTLPKWREKSNSKVTRVKVGVHPPKSMIPVPKIGYRRGAGNTDTA